MPQLKTPPSMSSYHIPLEIWNPSHGFQGPIDLSSFPIAQLLLISPQPRWPSSFFSEVQTYCVSFCLGAFELIVSIHQDSSSYNPFLGSLSFYSCLLPEELKASLIIRQLLSTFLALFFFIEFIITWNPIIQSLFYGFLAYPTQS